MFENTLSGPGTGTYVDHTIEILLMLLVAFFLGLLLGYILWYKWHKLYHELNAEHDRLKTVHLNLEKEHASLRYKLEESEKDNMNHRKKIMSLEGDVSGLRFKLDKLETDLAASQSGSGGASKLGLGATAVAAAAAIPAKKDNLKKIEGIGPKIEELCNDIGIWTFAVLAETSVERLQEMLDAAGSNYRIANPGTWPKQAELAATGKWDELKEYQEFLSGGRPPEA
jgi:predicted flap endonuclease-1-like 5' DNA nuclease